MNSIRTLLILLLSVYGPTAFCDDASSEFGALEYALSDAQNPADVPLSGWLTFDRDKVKSHEGIFWIRLAVMLRNYRPEQQILVRSLMAYELFCDDKKVLVNGVASAERGSEVPGKFVAVAVLPRSCYEDGPHHLAFRASSHHWPVDSYLYKQQNQLVARLLISPLEADLEVLVWEDAQIAIFASLNLFFALYFLAQFFTAQSFTERPRALTHLLFSACCLAVAVIGLNENFAHYYSYPYTWRYPLWVCLVLAVAVVGVTLPTVLLHHLEIPRKAMWLGTLLPIVLGSVIFAPEKHVGSYALVGVFVLCTLMAVYASHMKREFAGPLVVATLGCAVTNSIAADYFYLTFTGLMMVIVYSLIMQNRRNRERLFETSLLASQLEAQMLRKTIQPHFLMNSLTNIMEWVEVEPEKAGNFIQLLADEFRDFNKMAAHQMIPIEMEIELCRQHLDIMGLRLRKQFQLDVSLVEPGREVPPAIFHTLCENGISHNRFKDDQVVFSLGESLLESGEIEYEFKTPFMGDGVGSETGTGVKYVQSRLSQAYGHNWMLASELEGQSWVTRIRFKENANV